MAVSSSSLHWFCWVSTFSICFSCPSARDRLYSWYIRSWWTCLQRDWQAAQANWHRQRKDSHYVHTYIHTHRKTSDLIAPKGQSTSADVQNYVWSQTCQHHGFVLLRWWQLCPHNVQLPGQCRGTGWADGRGAAELTRPMLITENMWASRNPGETTQLGPTLWEVTKQCVVAERHGCDRRKNCNISSQKQKV